MTPGTPSIAGAVGTLVIALLTMLGVTLGPEAHRAIMDNMNAVIGGLFAMFSLVQLFYGVYTKWKGGINPKPDEDL